MNAYWDSSALLPLLFEEPHSAEARRAADAGHLFAFSQVAEEVEGLVLVSFDREMLDAARHLGLAVWPGAGTS